MKRLSLAFLALVLLSFACTALAAKAGDEVTVNVNVSSESAAFAQLNYSYNHSALEYVSSTNSYGQSSDGAFSLANLGGVLNGKIGTITFRVKSGAAAGTYSISVSASNVWDENENPASLSANAGSITVESDCTHVNTSWSVTKAATCTQTGTKKLICSDCNATLQTETIPIDANAHDWGGWTQTKAPTCMAKGEETRTCKRSSTHKETREVDIDPNAHNWGAWEQTTAPTCVAKGEETRTCTRNGAHKETREVNIDPNGHDWGEWEENVAPTCTTKGQKIRTCKLNGAHTQTGDIPIDSTAHNWGVWQITKAPLNGAPGEKTRICTLNSKHKQTEPFNCDHESSTWTQTKAPTCTAEGIESQLCDQCGVALNTRPIQPLDHDWGDWVETKAGNCTTKGEETRVCKRNSAHKETRQTVIDPNVHDWGSWKTTTAPTCAAKGEETRVCKRDGTHKETREIEIDPKAHDWGNWEITTAPTCAAKGEETRVCKRNNAHTETREVKINARAHDWGEWVDSETYPGHKERRCKNNSAHVEYDPPIDTSEWRKNQSVSSLGIRFRDIAPRITDKWYMFTPLDLSKDGVQEIALIAANVSKVGSVTVKVENGMVTIDYEVTSPAVEKDMTFTILPDLASVSNVEIAKMKTYAFGQEISISAELGGDTRVLLFVSGHVDYDFKDARNAHFASDDATYQQLVKQLREIME